MDTEDSKQTEKSPWYNKTIFKKFNGQSFEDYFKNRTQGKV